MQKQTQGGQSRNSTEDILQKEGAFDLLLTLKDGAKSFVELKKGGHSPNTVLARLRQAQRNGLVQSKLFSEKEGKKPRIKYVLTAEGEKLMERYIPIEANYLEMRRDIQNLEDQVRRQRQELRLLLTSVKRRK